MHARIAEYAATPARRRTLLVIAIIGLIFAGLIAFMFHVRATTSNWPVPFTFGSLLMVFAMAMFAICGSLSMVVGAASASKGRIEEAVRWIAIAISAWLVFLFLEAVEWVNIIYLVDLGPKTPFGRIFLLLTGAHWLAVIACVCWFTYVVLDVRRRDILASTLYSHFLAIWWIVLIVVLYLPNMNPLQDL